jgi:hypothetical protein
MEKTTYTKLSSLVGDQFTILEAKGYTFKRWNDEAKRFEISETYQDGFRKIYSIVTDKGTLDLGSGQLSTLLEAVYYKGQANINGKTFKVKSNGKSGMDIRYFFNVVRDSKPAPLPQKEVLDTVMTAEEFDEAKPIDYSEIPF